MATILVKVVFLSPEDGGRQHSLPVFKTPAVYRPHLVVQDRSVRYARIRNNVIEEEYWAVSFFDGPSEFSFGEPVRCRLILDWFPEADYSPLVKGATFTVREGAQIVGHGVMLERSDLGEPGVGTPGAGDPCPSFRIYCQRLFEQAGCFSAASKVLILEPFSELSV